MKRPSSRLVLIGAAAVLALASVPATALAKGPAGPRGDLLRSGVVGSTPPAQGGPQIFGVNAAGAPWVTEDGDVRVGRDGRLDLRIKGLVIPTPPQNGTNPIAMVTASLFCNAVRADVTDPFPLSIPKGDARVRADLTVPSVCVAPVVLIHPNGNPAAYIAASG